MINIYHDNSLLFTVLSYEGALYLTPPGDQKNPVD